MHKNDTICSPKLILALALCIFATPLFVLTIHHWSSAVYMLTLLMSFLYIAQTKNYPTINNRYKLQNLTRFDILFFIAFTAPIICLFIAQILQGHLNAKEYDGPIRYLFAIPIYWIIRTNSRDLTRWLFLGLALSPIIFMIALPFLPKEGYSSDPSRLSIYFVDSLTFGQIFLGQGIMSLILIYQRPTSPKFLIFLQVLGGLLGVYLSLKSGSRTGWLAVPIIFFFILWVIRKSFNIKVVFSIFLLASICFGFILTFTDLPQHFKKGIEDVSSYNWGAAQSSETSSVANTNSNKNLTSVGVRISMIRIGWDLIQKSPVFGWSRQDPNLSKNISSNKLSALIDGDGDLLGMGFHNEYVNTLVYQGVIGFFALIGVLFIPLIILLKLLKSIPNYSNGFLLAGIAFFLITIVSCFTYTVLVFKFTIVYYASLTAFFCGAMVRMYVLNLLQHPKRNEATASINPTEVRMETL